MSGEIESKDQDTEESQIAARWMREIELAGTHEKKWRDRAEKVLKRYRDEEAAESDGKKPHFNILYANTEVLRGVIYQKTPTADVRRRYLDKDPIGREAAQALQRALSFCVDTYDFDGVMHQVVEDYLLPGRGMARVKYVPSFAPMIGEDGQPVMDEIGQPMQQVIYETVETDYVEWDMVRISPAKRWGKVRWVAFGELLTRDELVQQFGEQIGRMVTLHWAPKDKEQDDEMFKRALVWTVWDKTSRKVHVVSKGYPQGRLKVADDPLNLEGFFPCPRPIYAVHTTNTMIPIPEYAQYQDQAMELDNLTDRIDALTDALRRRGVYNGSYPELEKLATAGDNEFIPVEKFSEMVEKGGLEKAIYESPVDTIATVLAHLMEQRESVKQTIYEITGLADIVRGVSAASETLGAQQLKARYANSRTGPRQKEVERFARDLFRLKAEIIAEKFSPQTIALMTGLDLPMDEPQKQALAQQAQAAGQPVPNKPTWEQVMQILKDDKLRGFRVDVETDSTVVPDALEEQKNRVELLTAVTQFIGGVAPAVQSGALPMPVAKEMLSFGVRGFKVSPQLEDALDQIGNEEQGQQQNPQQQQQEMMAQKAHEIEMRKQDAETRKAEAEAQKAEAQAQEAQHKTRHTAALADNQDMTNKGIQISNENDALLPQLAQNLAQMLMAMNQTLERVAQLSAVAAGPRRSELQLDTQGMPVGSMSYPVEQPPAQVQ